MWQKLICTTTEKFKEIIGEGSPNNTFKGPSRLLLIDPSLEPSAHQAHLQSRGRKAGGNPNHRMNRMTRPLPGLSQKSHRPHCPGVNPHHTLLGASKSSFRGKGMLPEEWDSLRDAREKELKWHRTQTFQEESRGGRKKGFRQFREEQVQGNWVARGWKGLVTQTATARGARSLKASAGCGGAQRALLASWNRCKRLCCLLGSWIKNTK